MSARDPDPVLVEVDDERAVDGADGGVLRRVLDARALGRSVAVVVHPAAAAAVGAVGLRELVDVVVEQASDGSHDAVAEAARRLGIPPDAFDRLDEAQVDEQRVRDDGRLRLRGGWSFGESGHRPEHEQQLGSNHMVGNGYLGHRGTFAEWRGQDGWVACTVSGTYDTADGKWRELTTVPVGVHGWWEAQGEPLVVPFDGAADGAHPRAAAAPHVEREYDIRHARSRRTTTFDVDGTSLTVEEQRVAHLDDVHVLLQRHRLRTSAPVEVVHHGGIDARIWSLNGVHLPSVELTTDDDLLVAVGTTTESGVTVAVAQAQVVHAGDLVPDGVRRDDDRLLRRSVGTADQDTPIVVDTAHVVYTSNDVEDPVGAARREARRVRDDGWSRSLASHATAWARVWHRSDVRIVGDLLAQTSLRFNVLHQVLCTPRHDPSLPIGARGLSCQAYQGAAFWDQEVFNLPMWLHTEPRIARQLIQYRVRTLDGARAKARQLGFDGAFYAWVSGDTGEELCPDFFFVDVLTGRPIRNHFNDWQIHVSPDIAVTVRRYVAATGDRSVLLDGAAEVVFEVARFCASRASLRADTGRAHVLRVLGPDEYHENVDDNAFTNHVMHAALTYAVDTAEWMRTEEPEAWGSLVEAIGLDERDVRTWAEVRDALVLPVPDEQTGILEQFAGFDALEDVRPDELVHRLQDPSEYWGWPNGVAVHTQVSKQADVVQLLVQLPERFEDRTVVAANHDHYLPRTQHGSSLSRSAYAITAARLGRPDEALDHLLESSTIDLLATAATTKAGTFIGGIRTAAAGGSWLALVQGLLGLRVEDDGTTRLDPVLPTTWDELEVRLEVRGARFRVMVDRDSVTVRADDRRQPALVLTVAGESGALGPGGERRVDRRV